MAGIFVKSRRDTSRITSDDYIVGLFVLATFVFENARFSKLFSIIQAGFFLYFIWLLFTEKKMPLNPVVKWACTVAGFAIILLTFHDRPSVETATISLIKNCLKALCISLYLFKRKTPVPLISSIAFSGIICGAELLAGFLSSSLSFTELKYATNSRIGADIAGGNVNIVAMNMCFAFSAWLYLIRSQKKLWIQRVFYGCLIFITGTALLTGTRKILPFFVITFFMANSDMKFKYKLITFIGIVGLYLALMNIEPLYFLVGHKIDFFNTSKAYSMYKGSDSDRLMLALGAIDLFTNHPFGLGFGNVVNYLGAYAHNNYTEVLASAGIFGFILYYGLYFWGLHISYRNRHDAISRYCLLTLVGLMVIEFGQVTYLYSLPFFFFPILCAVSIKNLDVSSTVKGGSYS